MNTDKVRVGIRVYLRSSAAYNSFLFNVKHFSHS
jgi:hypothetical protein